MKDRIHEMHATFPITDGVIYAGKSAKDAKIAAHAATGVNFNTLPVTVIEAPAEKVRALVEAVRQWVEASESGHTDSIILAHETLSQAAAALQETENEQ